jgi:hypothetical protein
MHTVYIGICLYCMGFNIIIYNLFAKAITDQSKDFSATNGSRRNQITNNDTGVGILLSEITDQPTTDTRWMEQRLRHFSVSSRRSQPIAIASDRNTAPSPG